MNLCSWQLMEGCYLTMEELKQITRVLEHWYATELWNGHSCVPVIIIFMDRVEKEAMSLIMSM